MGKGLKVETNEIGARSGDAEFTFEVGESLEDMRAAFRDDIIYHCAKAGMQSQLHQALAAATKNGGGLKEFAPNAGRQKIDPLMKALAGLTNEEASAKLKAAQDLLDEDN